MKGFLIKIAGVGIGVIMFIIVLLSIFSGLFQMGMPDDEPVSKIVLMIGDGMGNGHLSCAEEDYGISLTMKNLKYKGEVETASLSVTEDLAAATDSAAAATAVARGKSVYNGALVAYDEKGQEIENIASLAKANGLGVGIVTGDYLCGATPAAFSASEENRNNYLQIRRDQYESEIDLFLGVDYDDKHGQNYYAQEKALIEEEGYTFASSYAQLDFNANKLFGAFESVPANHEGGVDTLANPLLSELSNFAIQYMETNFPQGYFLMIEASGMDKCGHGWEDRTATQKGIEYLKDFDSAVKNVKKKFDSNGDDNMLIVTADHETGALAFDSDDQKYCYYSSQHTNWDVSYFIDASACSLASKIKNTEFFPLMTEHLGLS